MFLFCPLAAEAGYHPEFSRSHVTLRPGESYTLTVSKVWSGLTDYGFEGWKFGGDNERVAHVTGGILKEDRTGEVKVEALTPGVVHIYMCTPSGPFIGVPYVTVVVIEIPGFTDVHIAGPGTIRVGEQATYTAIPSDLNATYQWYHGAVGDVTVPLTTGPEMHFTSTIPGEGRVERHVRVAGSQHGEERCNHVGRARQAQADQATA
jgi:hypothetical protein